MPTPTRYVTMHGRLLEFYMRPRSQEGYSDNFQFLRIGIIIRDNGACRHCNATTDLNVAHLDSDKSNNHPHNLLTLCGTCHLAYDHKHSPGRVAYAAEARVAAALKGWETRRRNHGATGQRRG